MSTRCSIYCDDNIHLYWECLDEEYCLELSDAAKRNQKYDDPVLNVEELKGLYHAIGEHFKMQPIEIGAEALALRVRELEAENERLSIDLLRAMAKNRIGPGEIG